MNDTARPSPPDPGSNATTATASSSTDWTVREGTPVITFDGQKIGEVDNATGDFLLVKKGFLFPKEYSIPAAAIQTIGPEAVYLTVTKDIALAQGWDAPLTPETAGASAIPTTPAAAPPATVVTGDPEVEVASPLIGTFTADRTPAYADPAAGASSVDPASVESIAPAEATQDRDAALRTTATAPAGIGADAEEIPANPIATNTISPASGDADKRATPGSGPGPRDAILAEHDEVLEEGVDAPHALRTPSPLPAMESPAPEDAPTPADAPPIATDAALANEALDPLIAEDATEDPDPELPAPSGPADRV